MLRPFHYLALGCSIFCLPFSGSAQPDTVLIGAYVTDIYDIKMNENSFSAQFWVWFNFSNGKLDPLESLEIPNAKEFVTPNVFRDSVPEKHIFWYSKSYTAVFKKEWDIRRFPFDEQKMTIEFEEGNNDLESLVYVVDKLNTKLDSALSLPNWEITRFELANKPKRYNSSFGDPELNEGSAYAHAELNVYIKRNSLGLFFSLFTGMYVAFFISWLVFFIEPQYVDPRFGLSVGGLFASVGNKYIVDSVLPQSTTFTLVDKLHILTFSFLLLCIVMSVISLRLWNNGKKQESARFDRRAWKIILMLYTLANLGLIWGANRGG
ncbi:MAG: hypothetical protein H7246_18190 [Phycisphaerae bacterium]|nr:hypothetical protein [Saprospiraceae bacterium]